jgi:hypothetical protein
MPCASTLAVRFVPAFVTDKLSSARSSMHPEPFVGRQVENASQVLAVIPAVNLASGFTSGGYPLTEALTRVQLKQAKPLFGPLVSMLIAPLTGFQYT